MSTRVEEIAFLAGASAPEGLDDLKKRLLESYRSRKAELHLQIPQDRFYAELRTRYLQTVEERLGAVRDEMNRVLDKSRAHIATRWNVFAGDSLRTVLLLLSQGAAWWAASSMLGDSMRLDWPWHLRAQVTLGAIAVFGGTALLHYLLRQAVPPRSRRSRPRNVIVAMWAAFAACALLGALMLADPRPPTGRAASLLVFGLLTSLLALWLGTWRPADAATRYLADCEDRLNEISVLWQQANHDLRAEYETLRTLETRTFQEIAELDRQIRSDAEAIDRAFELGRVTHLRGT